jgi:hypothetical protein
LALAKAAIAELRARGAGVIHSLMCIEDDEAQAQGSSATWVCLSLPPPLANHNHFGGE